MRRHKNFQKHYKPTRNSSANHVNVRRHSYFKITLITLITQRIAKLDNRNQCLLHYSVNISGTGDCCSISLIIISYNHGLYIRQSLDSVMEIDDENLQILIVDDNSNDNSNEIISLWISENKNLDITFIANPTNLGLVKTLNTVLSFVKNDYVALLSGDDFLASDQLLKQARFLDTADDFVGAVYSDMQFVDQKGVLQGKWRWGLPFRIDSRFHSAYHELLRYNFLPAGATLVKRQVIQKLGGYSLDYFYEDYPLWLKLAKHYGVAYLPGIATCYRLTENSLSRSISNREKMAETEIRLLGDQIGSSRRANRIIMRRILEIILKSEDPEFLNIFNKGSEILAEISKGKRNGFLAIPLLVDNRRLRRTAYVVLFYGARLGNFVRLTVVMVKKKIRLNL